MRVKIVNKSNHQLPEYATSGSVGMDLRAFLKEDVLLRPMERKLIPTGLYMALPEGFEAQIRPRSGLAYRHGITVLNSPGTIDSDYRGEIGVLLVNLSNEYFIVKDGERIAQIVFTEVEIASLVDVESVDDLDMTLRGVGGFGHTGKN